jgi:uncharacterized protein (DUF58 family)
MALTGRAAALAALAIPVAAAFPSWPTLLLLALAVLALVLLDLALAGSVRALTLQRSGDTAVRLGEGAHVRLRIDNPARRRARGIVRDAWTPSAGASPRTHSIAIASGDAVTLETTLVPTRRGDRQADRITVRLVGPLGLAARQGTHVVPWTVRALPPFTSRRHLPSRLAALRDLDGRTEVLVRGQGTEFDSLREYVIGDDVRSIDWRATARNRDVMVRTWRPERDRRVLIVLDTGRTSAARVGDAPRLDAAMDAALLLAALAARAGDHVDLLAFDREIRADVTGVDGAAMLPRFVEALALVDPALVETDVRALVRTVLQRRQQRCLVVILTGPDPAPLRESWLPVLGDLTSRHHVVLASVSDPRLAELAANRGGVDEIYAAASAARAQQDRAAMVALLSRVGVEVVDAPPDRLPPALADRYLAMKAQGRL